MESASDVPETVAVAGVLCHAKKLLVIRRSEKVISPGKICFPGGKIQVAESLGAAIEREFREELNLKIRAQEKLWECLTSWHCQVHWMKVECALPSPPTIDQLRLDSEEVAEASWRSQEELLRDPDLLESNRHFLEAVAAGEISLSGT